MALHGCKIRLSIGEEGQTPITVLVCGMQLAKMATLATSGQLAHRLLPKTIKIPSGA